MYYRLILKKNSWGEKEKDPILVVYEVTQFGMSPLQKKTHTQCCKFYKNTWWYEHISKALNLSLIDFIVNPLLKYVLLLSLFLKLGNCSAEILQNLVRITQPLKDGI